MSTGLFISHRGKRCGVYQFGRSVFEGLRAGGSIDWTYAECDDLESFLAVAGAVRPDVTIFNAHPNTLAWARGGWGDAAGITFGIVHEVYHEAAEVFKSDPFDFLLCPDPTLIVRNATVFAVPRILPRAPIKPLEQPRVFTVGSFGFATGGKGFVRLCAMVNAQFDRARIRINMPPHDNPEVCSDATVRRITKECRAVINTSKIKLEITNSFFDVDELVGFLAGNTLNAFLYDEMPRRGISSCVDFAMAAGRPIAVSHSMMFRHLHGIQPSVCADTRTLREIASNGIAPLHHAIAAYAPQRSGMDWNDTIERAMARRHAIKRICSAVTTSDRILAVTDENFAAACIAAAALWGSPRLLCFETDTVPSVATMLRASGYRVDETGLGPYEVIVRGALPSDSDNMADALGAVADRLTPGGIAIIASREQPDCDRWRMAVSLEHAAPGCFVIDSKAFCGVVDGIFIFMKLSAAELDRLPVRHRDDPTSARQRSGSIATLSAHGRLFGGMKTWLRQEESPEPVFAAKPGDSGFILFGPYRPLARGRYRATVMVRVSATDEVGAFATLDVAAEGEPTLAARTIHFDECTVDKFTPLFIDFEFEADVHAFEVRVCVDQPIEIAVLPFVAVRPL